MIRRDFGLAVKNLPHLEELQHNQIGDQEFRATIQKSNPERMSFSENVKTNNTQLLMSLSGGAGVGKMMTTSAIYQQLLIYTKKKQAMTMKI